jgi:toxin-antitoxin system PIN domain toxin
MTPDVNVLVAASRADHPHYAVARAWLEGAVAASAAGPACSLMPMVLASFLRLVTSPKIFQQPTPIEDAVGFVDALLASPGVRLAPLGPEWSKLRQLCLDSQLGGNDLPDAWLSAAVTHLGEHLVTFDRDFRKFLARGQFTLLETGQPGPARRTPRRG